MHDTDNKDVTSLLVRDLLHEKRADRRWKNIRFIGWFALFLYMIISFMSFIGGTGSNGVGKGRYVSFIRLDGTIAPGRDFSAEEILPLLKSAFSDKNSAGVIIDINSPGGTPVQSAIIHDAIITFKNKYHKKVIVVGEDILASGAYYVAVAADKIYVNPNTLTGSIGVVMKSFGFVELMKKIGVERRVYASGNEKDRLDPFLPQNADDLKKIQQVTSEVHENFKQAVLQGRKGKLHANLDTLFNGDFWTGQAALKLGLVDGLGNLLDVMNKEFHTTHFKEYSSSSTFFKMLSGQINSTLDSMGYLYA